MTTYFDDIVDRVLAQCKEAVPAKEGFNYFGANYANHPYWEVGETGVRTEEFGSELKLTIEITGRLYCGKTDQDKQGAIQRKMRGYIPVLIAYFADRLDLTSEAFPEPMDGILEEGVFLNPIRKRIIGQPSEYFLELIFNVPVLQPTGGE